MKKEQQEKLLKLINHKYKLQKAYDDLDVKIKELAEEIGPVSDLLEITSELREKYPDIKLKYDDRATYMRVSLVDNMELASLGEAIPMVTFFKPYKLEMVDYVNKPKEK